MINSIQDGRRHSQSIARDIWYMLAKHYDSIGEKEKAKQARISAHAIPSIKNRKHWGWYG